MNPLADSQKLSRLNDWTGVKAELDLQVDSNSDSKGAIQLLGESHLVRKEEKRGIMSSDSVYSWVNPRKNLNGPGGSAYLRN